MVKGHNNHNKSAMKRLILSAFALIGALSLAAEEQASPWTMAGSAGITGSQVTLTNWAAGGD